MSRRFPKKRFSQVFLADKNIARKIVELLELKSGETVLEIGSGRGTLTELIAVSSVRLTSFEIDHDLIENLNRKFASTNNVTIVNADFLKADPAEYCDGKFKLIGNIPYDITSPLIDWMIKYREFISRAVITTQRELADRISSSPGSRDWAPISIFCQCAFNVKSVLTIPPKAFYPPPKIYSSTLVFGPADEYRIEDWASFEKVVRQSFAHRRKLLINNLALFPGITKDILEKTLSELEIDAKIRAEQIDINQFIRLSEKLSIS